MGRTRCAASSRHAGRPIGPDVARRTRALSSRMAAHGDQSPRRSPVDGRSCLASVSANKADVRGASSERRNRPFTYAASYDAFGPQLIGRFAAYFLRRRPLTRTSEPLRLVSVTRLAADRRGRWHLEQVRYLDGSIHRVPRRYPWKWRARARCPVAPGPPWPVHPLSAGWWRTGFSTGSLQGAS